MGTTNYLTNFNKETPLHLVKKHLEALQDEIAYLSVCYNLTE
jgi:hypothetical protein